MAIVCVVAPVAVLRLHHLLVHVSCTGQIASRHDPMYPAGYHPAVTTNLENAFRANPVRWIGTASCCSLVRPSIATRTPLASSIVPMPILPCPSSSLPPFPRASVCIPPCNRLPSLLSSPHYDHCCCCRRCYCRCCCCAIRMFVRPLISRSDP